MNSVSTITSRLMMEFICRQTASGLQLMTRTGILTASLLAGVAGRIWPVAAED